jgi:hypothetical protein
MFKASTVRFFVQLLAGASVEKVMRDVIVNNTNINTTFDAVRAWSASVVLGGMVADQAGKFVDTRFNEVLAWKDKVEQEQKEKQEQDNSEPTP